MKAIFYAGAILMAGACIYGFVDYKKTSGSKEFQTLYEEGKTTKPVVKEKKETVGEDVIAASQTETKKATVKKSATDESLTETGTNGVVTEKKFTEKITNKRIKKEKKVDYRLFSRARLEKYETPIAVEEKITEEEAKLYEH